MFYSYKIWKVSFLESDLLRENEVVQINLTLILTKISLIIVKVWLKFSFKILWNSTLGIIFKNFS